MSMNRTMSFFASDLLADFPTKTERLIHAPASKPLAHAEVNDRAHLATLLSARVPDTWPPETVPAPTEEDGAGWENWYVILSDPGDKYPVLVGIAGIKEWSPAKKTIQVGVSILSEFHGLGLGEEVVAALGRWALSQSRIDTAVCDIPDHHIAAAKSLSRAGYSKASVAPCDGFVRFELRKG